MPSDIASKPSGVTQFVASGYRSRVPKTWSGRHPHCRRTNRFPIQQATTHATNGQSNTGRGQRSRSKADASVVDKIIVTDSRFGQSITSTRKRRLGLPAGRIFGCPPLCRFPVDPCFREPVALAVRVRRNRDPFARTDFTPGGFGVGIGHGINGSCGTGIASKERSTIRGQSAPWSDPVREKKGKNCRGGSETVPGGNCQAAAKPRPIPTTSCLTARSAKSPTLKSAEPVARVRWGTIQASEHVFWIAKRYDWLPGQRL